MEYGGIVELSIVVQVAEVEFPLEIDVALLGHSLRVLLGLVRRRSHTVHVHIHREEVRQDTAFSEFHSVNAAAEVASKVVGAI